MSAHDGDGRQHGETYNPEEREALRAQMRQGNADARAELDRRGHRGPHPRVQALMDAGLWPMPYPGPAAGSGDGRP